MARRVRKTYKQKQRELEAPEIIEERLWSLTDWMEEHWKPVVGIVGGLALLWAAIGLFQIMSASSSRSNAERSAATFEAAGRAVYAPPADLEGEDTNRPLGAIWSTDKARAEAMVATAKGQEGEGQGLVGVLAGAGQGLLGQHDAQLAALDKALAGEENQALELALREQRASTLLALKKADEAAAE